MRIYNYLNLQQFKWFSRKGRSLAGKKLFILCFSLFLANAFSAQTDCCDQGDKAKAFTFQYTGEGCNASNTSQQDGKWDCDDFSGGPSGDQSVYIISSKDDDGGGDIYFEGTVSINESFTASASNAGDDDFPSNTYHLIYSSQGGTLLQRLKIHASCSAPIVIGDQFGSLILENAEFKNGFSCGPPPCDDLLNGGEIGNNESDCGPYNPDKIINLDFPDLPDPPNNNNDDCCDNGDKVSGFTMEYTGEGCSASNTNQQDDKWECDDFNGGPNGDNSVYIICSKDDDGGGDIYFEGTVGINESFTALSSNAGDDDFPSKVFFNIYSSNGGTLLQLLEIHASCSAPVVIGDQFGSLILLNAEFKNGFSCGPDEPQEKEYAWNSSTTGCPTSPTNFISGADDNEYDPPTISQTTYYVRWARTACNEGNEGWFASNCVVKTVENCGPCVDQGGDSDGDEVCDPDDNCVIIFNPNQADFDNDGVGNACDNCPNSFNPNQADNDNDGVGNVCDNCPNNFNPDQMDSDGDGIGDVCDQACPDADFDDICDPDDNCVNIFNPNQADNDNDGVGNVCDNCPANSNPNQADNDNDGRGNVCDNCPNDYNPDQADSDGDGIGDACDGGGCPATVVAVNCGIQVTGLTEPYVTVLVFEGVWGPQIFSCNDNECSNPLTIPNLSTGTYTVKVQTANGNGGWTQVCNEIFYVDVTCAGCPDADNDDVCDPEDNCVNTYNPNQADNDNDGVGNVCDNCPNNSNNNQMDSDNDGVGNVCDNCPNVYNPDQADSDGDGIGDVCDQGCPDADGDDICDPEDNCVNTYNPNQADSDNDGVGNVCDNCPSNANNNQMDSDNDGVGNVCDNCPNVYNPDQADSDGDGIGDVCDQGGCPANVVAINCGIQITGISEPFRTVMVYQGIWGQQIFSCNDNECTDPLTIPNLSTGTYTVKVQTANSNGGWTQVCNEIVYIDVVCGGCPDIDNDDVCDPDDNCLTVYNPNQMDSDNDGVGNACDNCPNDYNPNQADADGDGIGDACETAGCDNLTDGGSTGFGGECAEFYVLNSCPGNSATILNCVAPSGGTGAMEIIWLWSTTSNQLPTVPIGNIDNDPDWDIIPGANDLSYNPGQLSQTTYFLRCSRRVGCELYTGEGNIVTVFCNATPGGADIIGDFAWMDNNANGLQDAGEPGIQGMYIILEDENGGSQGFEVTGPNGSYQFLDKPTGRYRIKFANPGGLLPTTANQGNDDVDSDIDWLGYTPYFDYNGGTIDNIDGGWVSDAGHRDDIFALFANKEGDKVRLNWANNTSFKNDHFIVERSPDGTNFFPILEVEDHGFRNAQAISYNELDLAPMEGDNFYRVKVIYLDGNYDYTLVEKVVFSPIEDFTLYPNPATNQLYINLEKYLDKEVTISIYDQLGHLVARQVEAQLTDKTVEMDISPLQNGTYAVYIQTADGLRKARKVVVMKTY